MWLKIHCVVYTRKRNLVLNVKHCNVLTLDFFLQQNLVCKDKLKTTHTQMIYFAGVLVGALGLGTLSDM